MEKGSFKSIPNLVHLAKFEPNEIIYKIIESAKDSSNEAVLGSDSKNKTTTND